MIGIDTTFLLQCEMREVPGHREARVYLAELARRKGASMALCPQVIHEFLHVATDPRRFEHPLEMTDALSRAEKWWTARETHRVFPNEESMRISFEWQRQHRLGRKRLLDTLLAATYWENGMQRLLTLNEADFEIFGVFDFVGIP